jgi:membrane protein YdbS with pleckstrin-like domain
MAAPRLNPGEQIIFTAHPGGWTLIYAYVLTLGLYAFWRPAKHFTVTDQRVILSKGWVTRTTRFVPIHMVQDAKERIALGVGSVTISSAGGPLSIETFGPMRAADARDMVTVILSQNRAAFR